MTNEFYSRGITETWVTTGVFVVRVALGLRDVAPALAVARRHDGRGVVAYVLARARDRTRVDRPPVAVKLQPRPDSGTPG